MKLSQLITEYDGEDIEIDSIAFDVKDVTKNSLFFCLIGKTNDGHTFAQQAVEKGAVAVVVERALCVDCIQVEVEDARTALSYAAASFYGFPAKKLKMIGITGTNGKTTTSHIVKSILDAYGKKTAVIGTNSIIVGEKEYEAEMTTPDPIDLHRLLAMMVDEGMEYVVMEVSAHALRLKKVDGILFETAAFTNLSRDHLDYFESIDSYFEAKKSFFSNRYAKSAVVNADDLYGQIILKDSLLPVTTYGYDNPSDVFAIDLAMSVDGLEYILNCNDDIASVKFSMPGKFNMYNTLCAAAIAKQLEIPVKYIVKGIKLLKKVNGRFNVLNTSKCSFIIDFAHTDDGLSNILSTVKEFAPKNIITVFGCGGNRDRTKRPVMGKVVSELSDKVVITSDNPRYEQPSEIISEIVSGIEKDNYYIEPDRKKAIKKAIDISQKGDVIIVAGKGAEKYQEIMGAKIPYNDEQYILEVTKEYGL